MPRRVKVMKMVEEDAAASYDAIVEAASDIEDPPTVENCDAITPTEAVEDGAVEVKPAKAKRTPKKVPIQYENQCSGIECWLPATPVEEQDPITSADENTRKRT